jgi:hypothetical protein
MRQIDFESAVARATGESLRTIQRRGFSLVQTTVHSTNCFDPCAGNLIEARPSHESISASQQWGADSDV